MRSQIMQKFHLESVSVERKKPDGSSLDKKLISSRQAFRYEHISGEL